jgi:hypothetical protein
MNHHMGRDPISVEQAREELENLELKLSKLPDNKYRKKLKSVRMTLMSGNECFFLKSIKKDPSRKKILQEV